MKVLFVSNQVKKYGNVYKVVIEPLLELDHEVHWAADFSGFLEDRKTIPCAIHQIDITRNPLAKTNFKALRQLKDIISNHQINAIYCCTPIGGFLARLAGKQKGIRPVIYAAHGFAFYQGASMLWNLPFQLQERWLAHQTDALITINDEDMEYAVSHLQMRNQGHIYEVAGAGIDIGYVCKKNRLEVRKELDLPEDAVVFISAGALNKRKNYTVVIDALSKLVRSGSNFYYLICGEGFLKEKIHQRIVKNGLNNHIRLLGFRTDVQEIMGASDIFVLSSLREGLPRVTMEAMDLGLPCVVSSIRGNRDLIDDAAGGFLCDPKSAEQFYKAFNNLINDKKLRQEMGEYNRKKVEKYSVSIVRDQMKHIFKHELKETCLQTMDDTLC